MLCLRCNTDIEHTNKRLETQLCNECYQSIYKYCKQITANLLTKEEIDTIPTMVKEFFQINKEEHSLYDSSLIIFTHLYFTKKYTNKYN